MQRRQLATSCRVTVASETCAGLVSTTVWRALRAGRRRLQLAREVHHLQGRECLPPRGPAVRILGLSGGLLLLEEWLERLAARNLLGVACAELGVFGLIFFLSVGGALWRLAGVFAAEIG